MRLRQAAQQALKALKRVMSHGPAVQEAKDILSAALAEPEQEPVAWWNGKETVWLEHELMGTNPPIENAVPLYTAPTPRRPLTLEDIFDGAMATITRIQKDDWVATDKDIIEFARAIERAHGIGEQTYRMGEAAPTPRQWVGLTDEEIKDCFKITPDQHLPWHIYQRIEAALKEKNA